ncbi:MAG: sigma-70 family RNA polymerase sigma factor [Rubrobacteridae bacterium]|nr:sigma-70 family RNA polymerase sigma factor [Rubrobacteridae bacterium]
MTDTEQIKYWVDRAKTYDTEAFGKLYDLYYDKIYSYVYFKVSNRFEAEDIAEQVFLKALESISSFEWRGYPFSAWLFRIASNQVIDFYRSNKHEMVDVETEICVDGSIDRCPERSALREFSRQEVVKAIKMLTEDQRQVIVLRFIAGLSNDEVAKIVDKSVGAVKVLQHRALGALGRVLGAVFDEA